MSIVKANRILIDAFGDSVTTWDLQVLFVSLEESGVSLTDFVSEYGGVMRTAKRRLKLLIEAGVVEQIEHPTDYRRKLIVLPESTSKVVKAYLKELSKS
tara:strand:+ start:1849 stop:2145 length:297 start_codon:yes stop_codon:yes gene_type:complete